MPQEFEEQFDKNLDAVLMDAFALQSPQLIVGTLVSFWGISGSGFTSERGAVATISALEINRSVLSVYVSLPSFLLFPLSCLVFQLDTKKWYAYVKHPDIDRLEAYSIAVRLESYGTVQAY